jgi:hypothetical protein
MKFYRSLTTTIFLLVGFESFGAAFVSELDILASKMETISNQFTCTKDEECGSITLGWSDCAIGNLEYSVNSSDKENLTIFLDAAEIYEKKWKQGVISGSIPRDCRPQGFSKAECKFNRCALIGEQELPDNPIIIDPNLRKSMLRE